MAFGLPTDSVEMIKSTLKQWPEIEKAQIFGSRAMGNHRDNSDIDIALWGDIDNVTAARIEGSLEELPLPWKFDVVVYNSINHVELRQYRYISCVHSGFCIFALQSLNFAQYL